LFVVTALNISVANFYIFYCCGAAYDHHVNEELDEGRKDTCINSSYDLSARPEAPNELSPVVMLTHFFSGSPWFMLILVPGYFTL
jgi:hypothetical protein